MTQTSRSRVVIGAALWIIGVVQYFVAQVVAAAAWSDPPYSWSRNYVSDLGNTVCGPFAVTGGVPYQVCSPRHALMNTSFVLIGLCALAGAVLIVAAFPRSKRRTWGLWLWVLAGLGKVVVGLVPENTDLSLHTLGSLNLPLSSVAVLLFGLAAWSQRRWFAWFSLLIAAIGVAGMVVFTLAQGAHAANIGTLERVAGYPANLWMLVAAVTVLGDWGRDRGAPRK
jgi:hypothetical membrane protein